MTQELQWALRTVKDKLEECRHELDFAMYPAAEPLDSEEFNNCSAIYHKICEALDNIRV